MQLRTRKLSAYTELMKSEFNIISEIRPIFRIWQVFLDMSLWLEFPILNSKWNVKFSESIHCLISLIWNRIKNVENFEMLKLCFSFQAYIWNEEPMIQKFFQSTVYEQILSPIASKDMKFVEKRLRKNTLELKYTITAFQNFASSLCGFKLMKLIKAMDQEMNWFRKFDILFWIMDFELKIQITTWLEDGYPAQNFRPDCEFSEKWALRASLEIKITTFRNFRNSLCESSVAYHHEDFEILHTPSSTPIATVALRLSHESCLDENQTAFDRTLAVLIQHRPLSTVPYLSKRWIIRTVYIPIFRV